MYVNVNTMWTHLFLILLISLANAQISLGPSRNRDSVTLPPDNLDDSITQIFNICRCVIFYQCDEDNFIIPEDQLQATHARLHTSLRYTPRLKCSNEFYYCCKNKNETQINFESSTSRPRPLSQVTHTPVVLPPTRQPTSFTNSNCGQSGYAASSRLIEKFPWVVAVFRKRRANDYRFICGGSLIHPRVVMTEQQCVHSDTADEYRVVVGKEVLLDSLIVLPLKEIIKQELYPSEGVNDIALLVLKTPVSNARIVCLPNPEQNFSGRRCTAIGWSGTTGSGTRKLRKVNLPITDSQECQNLLRNTSLGPNFQVHPSYICAGGEDGVDTCKNDGGSPLMCEENGRYVQAGIVAWGLRCGQKDVPSLYTNVANLVTWIQEKLRDF
ncbi:phenoloxidase-activating factor 2-like [Zophobas morio]|uniref:phenoloxidase-activating factor 2-like n=1 Tax=Zophobas morio TaxID=2755281 RepID=UPI003082E623